MDGKSSNWRPGPSVCRCCLSDGCYKDIATEYFWMGKREVYEEMLVDTLGLTISFGDSNAQHSQSRLICETCISRLRNATDFKKQVKECEQTFLQYLNPSTLDVVEDVISLEKEEKQVTVKEEKSPDHGDDFNDNNDFLDDDNDDELDDQPLMNLATKVPKKESVDVFDLLDNAKPLVKRKSTTKAKTTSSKKAKIKETKTKPKEKPEKKKKDNFEDTEESWLKKLKCRGSAPFLRENSLMLLENSTMVVFQWHRSRLRCLCCKEPFSDITSLSMHMDINHKLKEIEKLLIVQRNQLLKVDISNLKCKNCDENVCSIDELHDHLKDKHRTVFKVKGNLLVPFKLANPDLQCQICFETFDMFRLLNIHVNKHFQKHFCHICGAGFTSLPFLNIHIVRYHRNLRCGLCRIDFKSRPDKRNHDITMHNVKLERKSRFPCPYCHERYNQDFLRVSHLVEKHGLKKPDHKCSICCKSFITRGLRNTHMRCVHLKKKNHECDVCQNLFYTKSDLTRHKVTHTREKKFMCSICTNLYATKDSLRKHERRKHCGR
ncbi:zinc finger and BTB domain-containing protein 41-like isoform X11 [Leptidea sinapis]|uniref:zinc finger and BTB domain-containing protein 41-like isoform X11 n=1 Tax=Leptidea sinapis TaxID=189913 RepID=UPI0021C347DA|nr:zinc finger and BTB domain-containing protein 41-like isoform X11 [Leptidea sinapis]